MLPEKMKKEFQFFNVLPEEDINAFLSFCENRQISTGETLWKEGDKDNYAAFILDGQLAIKKKTEFEGKHIIVGTYGKGSVVGELCLLTDNYRTVTAEIIASADLLLLSSEKFEEMLNSRPALGLKLLKNFFVTTSIRLRRSYDRIASVF